MQFALNAKYVEYFAIYSWAICTFLKNNLVSVFAYLCVSLCTCVCA